MKFKIVLSVVCVLLFSTFSAQAVNDTDRSALTKDSASVSAKEIVSSDFVEASSVVKSGVQEDATKVRLGTLRKAVRKATRKAVKEKKLTFKQGIDIRVHTISPAFIQAVENLAVAQLRYSGEALPTKEDGSVDRTAIDWDKLLAFIERLLPLILELIDALASNDMERAHFATACIDIELENAYV